MPLNKQFTYTTVLPDDLAEFPVNLLHEVDDKQVLWVGYRAQLHGADGKPDGRVEEEAFEVNGDQAAADAVIDSQVLPALRKIYLEKGEAVSTQTEEQARAEEADDIATGKARRAKKA